MIADADPYGEGKTLLGDNASALLGEYPLWCSEAHYDYTNEDGVVAENLIIPARVVDNIPPLPPLEEWSRAESPPLKVEPEPTSYELDVPSFMDSFELGERSTLTFGEVMGTLDEFTVMTGLTSNINGPTQIDFDIEQLCLTEAFFDDFLAR